MQFDYTEILILMSISALIVIILLKLIYRHNPHYSEQYGKEIVLFHRADRYKRRVWRFNLIEELKNQKINGKISNALELKVIVGEFSEGTQEIIKHAANHKFDSIKIIAGPKVFCEDKMEIYTLLDKYSSVEYFILPKRPNKHFMIFNKSHLYIEKPHRHHESRGSVGIKKAQMELIKTYDLAFNEMLEFSSPINKEDVLNQKCY
ncbi:MAG: hypothetical protein Q7U35_08520 [Methanobacteriaceae archaeon]|jgi:hypothetical protein|nr:hypothetical protein [Methanobacteriaceae archaeon]MDP2836184.1 hypothetical protein [Methanobacteriaceae archaeon]MDP3035920.1 hypothetical protein [Methanobacteriaceae archaeon]MDP3484717.1 hypothetical protein [Methanobacteriaceae archaeon]MDP3624648.1 hypothetical protein [Methanobacteriaceae archaeon]